MQGIPSRKAGGGGGGGGAKGVFSAGNGGGGGGGGAGQDAIDGETQLPLLVELELLEQLETPVEPVVGEKMILLIYLHNWFVHFY